MVLAPLGLRERRWSREGRDLEVIRRADVVSPWTVGRYRTPEEAAAHAEKLGKPDLAWCRAEKKDYLPVVFPGFSWHNMHGGPLDQIPRLKGRFLWSQLVALKRADASMIYVAMFDEVDEATAIFKCRTRPDGSPFVRARRPPPDHGRLLRGEIPPTDELPR